MGFLECYGLIGHREMNSFLSNRDVMTIDQGRWFGKALLLMVKQNGSKLVNLLKKCLFVVGKYVEQFDKCDVPILFFILYMTKRLDGVIKYLGLLSLKVNP